MMSISKSQSQSQSQSQSPSEFQSSTNHSHQEGQYWMELVIYGSLMGTLLLALSPRMNKRLQLPLLFICSALLLCCTNMSIFLSSAVHSSPMTNHNTPAEFGLGLRSSSGSGSGSGLQANLAQSQGIEQVMAKYRVEITELKSQVDFLNQQLNKCINQQDQFKVPDAAATTDATATAADAAAASTMSAPPPPLDRSAYCSLFPHPIPSALQLWNSNLKTILKASQHELDRRWVLHDFTSELLDMVSPDRLARSVVSLPHEWEPVKRVLEILYQRYLYLNNRIPPAGAASAQEPPRPLKVLVMGGSLIVGVNCRKIVSENELNMQMPNRLCTWTHRLESTINKLLGGPFVEIHKIALGGTNTETGFVMWDSHFLPEETKHPDILINAYSTNDMHILTVLQAQSGNQTLRDKVMEMTQHFVRSVLKDGGCAPLLLHIDDYLGNEQREILATTELSQAVQVLAHYYGFSSMSYANVVRDIVYGDTKESWISPAGWYEGNTMVREIHPGMGMHILSSWVMAYNLLNLATTYCTIETMLSTNTTTTTTATTTVTTRPYQAAMGELPPLKGNKVIPGKPKTRPAGLPPPLVKSLSLVNVTSLWKAAKPRGAACSSAVDDKTRCPFAWFSGISKQGMNETYAQGLFSTNNKYVAENTGWDIDSGGGKLGMSPRQDREHPKFTIRVEGVQLSSVTLFYMKSYGDRWINSKMSVTIRIDGIEQGKHKLVGIHDKETSETYTHRIDLPDTITITQNGKYEVTMEHLGGVTFKIMGLAICK